MNGVDRKPLAERMSQVEKALGVGRHQMVFDLSPAQGRGRITGGVARIMSVGAQSVAPDLQ